MGDSRHVDVEHILAEAPWVRRLARGLVREEGAAEDLSQDVLAAALTERPDLRGLTGAPLRSWLRTVARRLAGRSYERDAARRQVEAHVARPDPDEAARGADERLELHRRLSTALDRLPPLYRTALVLRFLEELPPREIAARLGIADTAARKRVSRGLSLLREELDRDFGGRDTWLAALAPFASPSPSPFVDLPGPSRRIPLEVAVMGVSLPKLAVAGATAVAAVLLLVRVSPRDGAPRLEPLSPAVAGLDPSRPAPAEDPAPLEAEPARRVAAAPAVHLPSGADTSEELRLYVVDAQGAPVPGAVAAYVDSEGGPTALELDEASTAALPASASDLLWVARAPGHGSAFGRPEAGEELTLILPPARSLTVHVTEEGEPPAEPLTVDVSAKDPDISHAFERNTIHALNRLGALSTQTSDLAVVEGRFEVADLPAGQLIHIQLPQTHRLMAVDGEPWIGERDHLELVPRGDTLELDTVRLPMIKARVVWDDDGSPIDRCAVMAMVHDRLTANSSYMGVPCRDGELRFGVPVVDRSLTRGRAAREADLDIPWVRFDVHVPGGSNLSHRVELQGATYPLDLGELRVQRRIRRPVRILAGDGSPVEGASIRSSLDDSATSDATGSAALTFHAGDTLSVLAMGYELAQLTVPADVPPTEPFVIMLEAGVGLVLVADFLPRGAAARISWDQAPFSEYEGPQQIPRARYSFHQVLGNTIWSEPGSMRFTDVFGPRYSIPGLIPGASVRAEIVDSLGAVLTAKDIVLPEQPGIVEVHLEADPGDDAFLELVLEGPPDVRLDGWAWVGSDPARPLEVTAGRGRSDALAPGRYPLRIEVAGFSEVSLRDVLVEHGAPPLVVPLAAERRVTVEVRDEAGRVLTGAARLVTAAREHLEPEHELTGLFSFAGVPLEPVELELTIGTRTWTRSLSADEERVEFELPRHGELSAVWQRPVASSRQGRFGVELTPVDGSGSGQALSRFTPGVATSVEVRADLLPGDYDLTFVLLEDTQAGEVREALGRRRVTVAAEGLTRVSLD